MSNKKSWLLVLLVACLILAAPAYADNSEGASGGLLSPDDEYSQSIEAENKGGLEEGEKAGESSTGEKTDGVNLDFLPAKSDVTEQFYSEVRAIVGDTTEIINITGLDVPLADGSTFYIPFVDVAADAYYTEAVAWAYKHDPQITAGVTELSFGPNQTCTRGQMVTFLWRAAGCPEPTGTASAFSDVTAGAYYEKAVAWAVENNITDGVGGGRFDPNGIVNRAQAVTFLYRAKGKPAVTSAAQFTDVAAGEYYADAVAWAVANEVTNGVSDNAFAPNNNCVRGQTVTFLYRAYK